MQYFIYIYFIYPLQNYQNFNNSYKMNVPIYVFFFFLSNFKIRKLNYENIKIKFNIWIYEN